MRSIPWLSLNPLWSGLLGRPKFECRHLSRNKLVSIPSGRGFWAGLSLESNRRHYLQKGLNPLWSGLLGRRKHPRQRKPRKHPVSIPSGRGFWAGIELSFVSFKAEQSQSPLVGASGPAMIEAVNRFLREKSQSPLVGASGPAPWERPRPIGRCACLNPLWSGLLGRPSCQTSLLWLAGSKVSIPSGRGFWAGLSAAGKWGRKEIVSIPSGRGFWAGFVSFKAEQQLAKCLNPLWSGLLGRLTLGADRKQIFDMSQSPLVGASGPAFQEDEKAGFFE